MENSNLTASVESVNQITGVIGQVLKNSDIKKYLKQINFNVANDEDSADTKSKGTNFNFEIDLANDVKYSGSIDMDDKNLLMTTITTFSSLFTSFSKMLNASDGPIVSVSTNTDNASTAQSSTTTVDNTANKTTETTQASANTADTITNSVPETTPTPTETANNTASTSTSTTQTSSAAKTTEQDTIVINTTEEKKDVTIQLEQEKKYIQIIETALRQSEDEKITKKIALEKKYQEEIKKRNELQYKLQLLNQIQQLEQKSFTTQLTDEEKASLIDLKKNYIKVSNS